ncbi:MAG: ribbon-helix-helix protein, CopG family, partial [Okeania sp. SIO2D1]|nr:ribbon-helix-helix protein, CopG family [Okeania sp. SIO2D1]
MARKRSGATSYSESKVKVGVSLTPTSAERLKEVATELGLSRSELIERIARGDLAILREAAQIQGNLDNQSETVNNALKTNEVSDEKLDIVTVPEPLVESVETQNQLSESYQALQQELASQMAQVKHLEDQMTTMVSRESYETLHKQLEEDKKAIVESQAQLAQLKQLEEQVALMVSQ